MSLQQAKCRTHLDLSTTFDTIVHSILLGCLSAWFGITSTALSWIKSYLLNHSFYVNIQNTKSSLFHLLYGVPQGSILGLLLFKYTPLLSVLGNLIHLQIIISMQMTLGFSHLSLLLTLHIITLIFNTISSIYNWM
jgi:Reverse transcriptase (RNA-dependent DNA polymerase)